MRYIPSRRFSYSLSAQGDHQPFASTRQGFVHALYQNVLYGRLPASRRVQLHRRIGERGEEVYGERAKEIAGELAMHFERGRDYKRAAKYLQQAADNAIRRFAYQEAVALARRGIELLGKLPETAELYRLKGELLRKSPEAAEREVLGATRAISLAHLYQSQNKEQEARECVVRVFDGFTEGFDTADLKQAKALLT